jgi:beta-lactamase class C
MRRLIVVVVIVVASAILFFVVKQNPAEKTSTPVVHSIDSVVQKKEIPEVYVATLDNPHWKQLLAEYESYLHRALENNQAPGVAIALVRDSSILYLQGLGYSNRSTGDSVSVNSIFRLGSVSKSFASVLTGILVQEGILSWNDKVTKYVPSFRLKSKAFTDSLTIAHVLSHTTGLPYHAYTDRVDDGANFDTLVYHLRDLDLIGPPGKVYSYQNVAYSLISKVIEAATGKSYEAVISATPISTQRWLANSTHFTNLLQRGPCRWGEREHCRHGLLAAVPYQSK